MRQMTKPLLLIAIVLALPIVPAVVYGELFGQGLAAWRAEPPSPLLFSLGVAAILASDLFLPVPSSPLMTLAGAQLGWLAGTLVCWLGLTTGAVAAFALARRWGPALVGRLVAREELERMRVAAGEHFLWMLLVTRPLPVLAEAAVLLAGLVGAPWRQCLPTIAIGNMCVAACFCVMGQFAEDRQWLTPAIVASMAIPLVLSWLIRRRINSQPGVSEATKS